LRKRKYSRSLRPDHEVADTHRAMRYDVELASLSEGAAGERDLSFATFSLAHAACGDEVLEVRIGERMLLAWCMGCAVMEVFGLSET
jgi:hypothetical protein